MIDEKQKESWFKKLSFKLEHISFSQKIFLVDNLRVMLKAGLSIIESLEILEAQMESAKLKRLIGQARQDVEKGKTLADALEKIPELFPAIYVKMIAAGEVSGNLDESLSEAVIQMKKTYAMNSKIRGAMVYPLVILVAVVGIGIEMMVVVLPKLLTIFNEMNVAMPLPTRVLIFSSNFLIKYGLLVVIVVAALVALFIKLKRRPDVQFFLHSVLLKIPVLGHISYQINLARFS
ncbi:MAG: type II secretion system F family protein, partial [Patescibacteria group bacterium]